MLGLLGGCSVVLTRDPPAVYSQSGNPEPVSCASSMTAPLLDAILAGVAGIVMIGALDGDRSRDADDSQNGGLILTSLVVTGAATASAVVGYGRVTRCRAYKTAYAREHPSIWWERTKPQPPLAPAGPVTEPVPPPPPPVPAPDSTLGTEGDVCTLSSECAAPLTCKDNVCLKP
jgi:hypothetical protein